MLFMIIISVAGFIYLYNYIDDIGELILAGILSLAIGGLSGLALGTMYNAYYPAKTHYELVSTHELISLKDNSTVSGHFFLGSGNIDGVMVFAYYQKVGDGFALKTQPSNSCTIKYHDGTPVIEEYVVRQSEFEWFAIHPKAGNVGYVFKIPHGSIDNQFKLDAQ